MSGSTVDYIRLLIFASMIGLIVWSAIPGTDKASVIGAKDGQVGGANEVRKLIPDFSVCGEGSVRTESYKDDKRVKCSAVVREATIYAQTKCAGYLENEAACRQERASQCDIHHENGDGCQRLVVLSALSKAGLKLK
jgi:hypothetical protein